MSFADLPTLNAVINLTAAILLWQGRIKIRGGRPADHKRIMLIALSLSVIFLISYLIYHSQVGSVPYPYYDWTRIVYLLILFPHIILAGLQVPFIIIGVAAALRGRFQFHRRLMRWVWPVWMFVSASGVAVYVMLYLYARAGRGLFM